MAGSYLSGFQMVAMHAKDFVIKDDWVKMVPVGTGLLNYDVVLKHLKRRKPFINVLLENTREPHIDNSIKFLREKYQIA